jgi:DNA processing protein
MRAAWRGEPGYPPRLDALGSAAPKRVFFAGPMWSPEVPGASVVGARRASEGGRAWARALGRALAEGGWSTVSGGALGIDGAAHRGALEGGGRTLVVLPAPVDDPAPLRHRGLFREVVEAGGTLLSEYERRQGRFAFSKRNRLIAALGDVVVVVEARARSGTRHTAEAARRLGRPLLVKRWPPGDARGEGGRDLAALGARWVDAPDEVLDILENGPPPESPPANAAEAALLEALDAPMTLDALAARLSTSPRALAAELLELELAGKARKHGGRWERVA